MPTRERGLLTVRHIPVALLEYPFELAVAFWGFLSGLTIVLGYSTGSAAQMLMPLELREAWGFGMLVASVTICAGIVTRRYARVVASGLRLLGAVCFVYSVAILAVYGWKEGVPGGPLLTAIAVLCYFRAWWLKMRHTIACEIERSQ